MIMMRRTRAGRPARPAACPSGGTVDAADSKSVAGNGVLVQVRPGAPFPFQGLSPVRWGGHCRHSDSCRRLILTSRRPPIADRAYRGPDSAGGGSCGVVRVRATPRGRVALADLAGPVACEGPPSVQSRTDTRRLSGHRDRLAPGQTCRTAGGPYSSGACLRDLRWALRFQSAFRACSSIRATRMMLSDYPIRSRSPVRSLGARSLR